METKTEAEVVVLDERRFEYKPAPKVVVPPTEVLDLFQLKKERDEAEAARNRFLQMAEEEHAKHTAEAAKQQAIMDEKDERIAAARKAGLSESIEVDQPFIGEGSPAPQNEEVIA